MEKTGVIVVDVQGDFTTFKKGSLAVDQTGQDYIDKVKAAVKAFKEKGVNIFATQDWHPETHISFFTNTAGKQPFDTIEVDGRTQILWPPHCVQGTKNAELLLNKAFFTKIIQKGCHPEYDSYSGFQDDGGIQTQLDKVLKSHGITSLIVFGLATDFCVKATAMDARANGYQTTVIKGLCKGVAQESTSQALEEMKKAGVDILAEFEFSA